MQIIVIEKGIEIRTPLTKKDSEIKQLVDDKKQWIFKKKLEFSDRRKKKITKTKSVSENYLYNRRLPFVKSGKRFICFKTSDTLCYDTQHIKMDWFLVMFDGINIPTYISPISVPED